MLLHYCVKVATCVYVLNPHLASKSLKGRGSSNFLVSKANKVPSTELRQDRQFPSPGSQQTAAFQCASKPLSCQSIPSHFCDPQSTTSFPESEKTKESIEKIVIRFQHTLDQSIHHLGLSE